MQKDLAQVKISLKVVGGYFFDSPCTFKKDCRPIGLYEFLFVHGFINARYCHLIS